MASLQLRWKVGEIDAKMVWKMKKNVKALKYNKIKFEK